LIAVFDIDGVLANCDARVEKYLTGPVSRGEKKDWVGFFAYDNMLADRPIVAMLVVMERLANTGVEVMLWTGRPEMTRRATLAWLERHTSLRFLRLGGDLWMRPDGDRCDDDFLKARYLNRSWFEGRKPDIVFEDRARIVKMYREHGILCCQTADGNF
jgi:hypothetical protein